VLLTTTSHVEGRPVARYLGLVSAEAIVGANVFRDFFASVRDAVGGRVGGYEKALRCARADVLKQLEAEASRLGADAIIGIAIDYDSVGRGNSMLMIAACGTAVTLRAPA
jgi:uncharacterized protein YbjQ (UPF0145 family)